MTYPRVASFKTHADVRARLASLGLDLPCDREILPADASPLAQPVQVADKTIGNRFCVLPMEGWDGTPDGRSTELTRRRWRNFGASGPS